jgi:polysaccharide deacetylase family protein (PEP-CTERM system associated)
MPSVLSIDVEEYFQVVNLEGVVRREDWPRIPSRVEVGLARLAELLDRSGSSATLFVLGCVAERNPACIRRLAEAGLEIASHGFDHRRLWDLDPEELDRDLQRTEEAIGAASGVRVRGYRAPHFSIDRRTTWAFDVLIDRGYLYDSSVFPGRHPEYGMPDAPRRPFAVVRPDGRSIAELPIAAASIGGLRLAMGGGYFRLYPYRLTRFLLRRLGRQGGSPSMFYVHPWELDPEQPRLPLSWWRRLRQYQGLRATEPRLRRLLLDFRFTDASSVIGDLELEPIALDGAAASRQAPRSAARLPSPGLVQMGAQRSPALAYEVERQRESGTG